ncbi:substrate-binding domain-containing protein [Flavobacterium sp. Sd200]|uniref:LacI family DNA-binding transcriptional regulator n=1 Tax=Flavobacterium sp. Sd200 TaxID=2692211 RepID=UPI00136CC140|nr:LacI family DNA-binding transcriptional regulator [Flavobacterium sp. Sd200]MXN90072.1 substrate-binding domain-containing protein [Flavobacterium sp. Sd200]
MDKKNITIYDISEKLNISAATVSRALNDDPKVSQATKELVLKTAKEMNYKQNKLAKALKSGSTKNVGIIVPYINTNFFSSVIRGVEEELTPQGYHVIICQSHEDYSVEIKQLNTLLNAQVDCIFMSLSKTTLNTDYITRALNTNNTPIIFFDRKKDISGISSVTIDDYKGGYLATEHLIKQGCKNICHFSGNHNLEIYQQRYNGYADALKAYGLTLKEDYIITTASSIESGADAVRKLWDRDDVPDAIFSSSDFAALGACKELKAKGINIPNEVAVIGFSNEPFTEYMEMPMSSVDQTPVLMGKMAGQVFLEGINESNSGMNIQKKVVLKPELLIRKSSLRK